MLTTIITVALALAAVGLWIHTVEPMLAESAAATTRAAGPLPPAATTRNSDHSLRMVVTRTMLLAFLLICMLLVVGFFATLREWILFRTTDKGVKRGKKTRYVDAWKLAGERMKLEDNNESDEPPPNS
jgi:hypothetical protein